MAHHAASNETIWSTPKRACGAGGTQLGFLMLLGIIEQTGFKGYSSWHAKVVTNENKSDDEVAETRTIERKTKKGVLREDHWETVNDT